MNVEDILVQEKLAYARVEAPCPYFGTCGGCTLQDLAYADQLALKRARLQRAFTPLGDMPPIDLVGLDDPWRYRNKAEFTFGESDGRLVLGYHEARSFWRLVDLQDCLLLPEPATRLLNDVRGLAAQTGLPAYQPKTHQGFFRYLVVRSSRATGQLLVCLITTPIPNGSGSEAGGRVRELVEGLIRDVVARHPSIVGFYWGRTARLADIAVPDELALVHGSPYLEETLGPFRLQLAPSSFLQPTGSQADRMYRRLCEALRDSPSGVAWDLYCGLGLVALYLAAQFRKIYGIDAEAHHLELAARNASANGVTNIEFRAGRVEALLADRRFWLQEAKPDAVVVDPPRAGLHPKACASLVAARPSRIAYLSCNVHSLVRDLRVLLSSFPRYRLAFVQAFDMFPQTHHVEVLALLHRH